VWSGSPFLLLTCDKGAAPDWKSAAACIEIPLAAIGVFPVVAVHLCDCRFSLCDHGGLLQLHFVD